MDGSTFWNRTVPRLLSSYAVLSFVILWIGFAAALIVDPGWLEEIWNWVQATPSVVRILAWIFLTPLMTALWVWDSSWSTILQVLGFVGIAGWTALAASSFRKAYWTR